MAAQITAEPVTARTFLAMHSGTCSICEERYAAETPIISTPYGWAHDVCPEPKPLGAVCAGCFTEIALNGECLC
ncbi:hypothetical protein [Cryobacterium zhongshanensis]|uniref:Uncharacterized protein n=1 Tax=Cryobacterium zhongshanensis TaxID=2928153 RepID=A0AA41UGE4_9MICO|nr:hypothetical protein [Cryobacterium zhongshanensis]MCI4659648.1 hypothetical protein [Cryobacterium zhongshanensis]